MEAEAATTALVGLGLAALIESRFVFMPITVASMVWLHAVQGWYPLLPLFRRLGVRTRGEVVGTYATVL